MKPDRSLLAYAFIGALLLSGCDHESAEQAAAREQQDKLAYRMRDVAAQARTARIAAIGVHEAAKTVDISNRKPDVGNRFGSITVTVAAASNPVILVLSSYQPVRWVIQAEPGADVAAVLVGGYYPQQVTGVSEWHVHDLGRVFVDEGNTGALDSAVRRWTGKPIEQSQGSYYGDAFRVGPAADDTIQ
jgi:hypothetical protein